jgi:phytoene synthase
MVMDAAGASNLHFHLQCQKWPAMAATTEKRTGADELAFQAARTICRRHAKSFYYASVFLPRVKRDAVYAVYAFCRMIDDAINQPGETDNSQSPPPGMAGGSCCSTNSLEQRLEMFRARLNDIYAERLELPLPEFRSEEQHALRAFALTAHRYEIPRDYFMELAEGCRMDLTIRRYATWNALEKYCYRVAGVVGLIMSCIFGLQHSDAGRQMVQMGNAMQLTNILRDIQKDHERGRIYLPLEDMARFGYTERDLDQRKVNDAFRSLMKFEIARARSMYEESSAGLCWLADDGSRVTAATMAVVYSGILKAIETQQYDVFSRRASLSTPQKLRRLPAAWKLARRGPETAVPRVF